MTHPRPSDDRSTHEPFSDASVRSEAEGDSDVMEQFLRGADAYAAGEVKQAPTIAQLLGSRAFIRAEGLSESAAERSVDLLVTALERRGIFVDRPFHLTGRDYYAWLRNDFLQHTMNFPVGDGWQAHYTYAELVPRSAQAMYVPVDAFLNDLLGDWDGCSAYHFAGAVFRDLKAYFPEPLRRYIDAWAAAYPLVCLEDLRPVGGRTLSGDRALFSFELRYDIVREDDSEDTFAGRGEASLRYREPYWEIIGLCFPGFFFGTGTPEQLETE